jgi:hypothetical protein
MPAVGERYVYPQHMFIPNAYKTGRECREMYWKVIEGVEA